MVALVAPVAVLVAVVGLGVAGRISMSPPTDPSRDATRVAVGVTPSATPWPTLDPNARPTVIPFLPRMPFVADQREHGTDGLMGRLPFDLPPDEPLVGRANRFTIDDVLATRVTWATTPPWVTPSAH